MITAKEIKAAIKNRYPSLKKVGVTTQNGTDTTFSVVIPFEQRDIARELRAFCEQFQRVDRCEVTGEILSGGNTYVCVYAR